MDNRLKDRIAIITGGSSGLGKATALRFADSGARIVIADLKSDGVEDEITTKHGQDSAVFVKVDVTQEAEIKAMVQQAVEFGGGVDILVNYAGISLEGRHSPLKAMHEFPTEDFDKTWAINARGTWLTCKYTITQFLSQPPLPPNARGESTRGWILNVASTFGLLGGALVPAYCPSKHAVVGMTKQIAATYAKERIHVNALAPSFVRTPLTQSVLDLPGVEETLVGQHPWGALGIPEDFGGAGVFLCSEEAAWITGQVLAVDGGYSIV